jgi:hypothetical protein
MHIFDCGIGIDIAAAIRIEVFHAQDQSGVRLPGSFERGVERARMAYMQIAGGRRCEAPARTGLSETRRLGNCFAWLFDFTGSLKLFHVEQF